MASDHYGITHYTRFSIIFHAQWFLSSVARVKAIVTYCNTRGLGELITPRIWCGDGKSNAGGWELEAKACYGGRRGVVKMTLTCGRRRRPPQRPRYPRHPSATAPYSKSPTINWCYSLPKRRHRVNDLRAVYKRTVLCTIYSSCVYAHAHVIHLYTGWLF
jgi:hypothetical protein